MDTKWIQPSETKREVDLGWLNRNETPVRGMFEPPKPPPAQAPVAPPKMPSVPPAPPAPPPGPSPEELRVIAEYQQAIHTAALAVGELQEAAKIEAGRTAELITEMALAVAEELAAGAIELDENRVIALIIQALELLNAEKEVKVYLNPDLYERLVESGELEPLRKEHHLTIRSEARVADQGCIVESTTGQVDARVKSRLRQLRHLLSERMGTRESS